MARVLGEARSRARLRESTSTWYNSSQWKLLLQSFKNRPSCGLVWHSRADASPWRLPCGQGIFCVNCRNRSSGCRRPERLCWRRRSSSRQSSRRSRRTCQRTNTNRHRWKRLTRRHGEGEEWWATNQHESARIEICEDSCQSVDKDSSELRASVSPCEKIVTSNDVVRGYRLETVGRVEDIGARIPKERDAALKKADPHSQLKATAVALRTESARRQAQFPPEA